MLTGEVCVETKRQFGHANKAPRKTSQSAESPWNHLCGGWRCLRIEMSPFTEAYILLVCKSRHSRDRIFLATALMPFFWSNRHWRVQDHWANSLLRVLTVPHTHCTSMPFKYGLPCMIFLDSMLPALSSLRGITPAY